MPSNQEEDKEGGKKNGAGSWAGFGTSGGGAGVRVAASAGRSVVSAGLSRTAGQSLLGGIGQFFSTGTGMVAVAGIIGSASIFSLWNINHPRDTGDAFDEANQSLGETRLPGGRRSGTVGSEAPRAPSAGGGGADSLSYLAQANQTGSPSDGGQPIDNAAQAQAASAALEAAQRGSPDNSNAPANTQTAVPRNVGQMTTNLNSGGGSSSHGGMFAGNSSSGNTANDSSKLLAKAAPGGGGAYGASSAVPNTAARSAVVGRSSIQRVGGGGAMGQLQSASSISRNATMAGSTEGQSYGASKAFEGTAGLGSAGGTIGGGGTGVGSGGSGTGQDTGSPINLTKNDTQQPPQANSDGQNATPWQSEATMATILLAIAGVLLIAANMIKPNTYLAPYKRYIAMAASALGATVAVLGMNLMTRYGQTMQGGIFMAAGAIIGVIGAIVAISEYQSDPPTKIVGAASDANTGIPSANGPATGWTQNSARPGDWIATAKDGTQWNVPAEGGSVTRYFPPR